mgnify:CR=1 FL=1
MLFTVVYFILDYIMWNDEKLSPEIKPWIDIINSPEQGYSDSYYYLIGMDAPEKEDPVAWGKKEQDYTASGEHPGDHKYIKLPEGEFYCRSYECRREIESIRLMLHSQQLLLSEVSKHKIFLERYHQLLVFKSFSSLPNKEELHDFGAVLYPQAFLIGNRLNAFQIILQALAGNKENARISLINDINNLKAHLALTDNVIYKLFLATAIYRDIELMVQLYRKGLMTNKFSISQLTIKQKSLALPVILSELTHLLRGIALLEKEAGNQMQEQPYSAEMRIKLKEWEDYGLMPIFKKNMSLNTYFPYLKKVNEVSELPSYQMINAIQTNNGVSSAFKDLSAQLSSWTAVKNPLGNALIGLTVSNYDNTVSRLHILDARIKLANIILSLDKKQVISKKLLLSLAKHFNNPFYPSEKPYLNSESNKICYRLEDGLNLPRSIDDGHICMGF